MLKLWVLSIICGGGLLGIEGILGRRSEKSPSYSFELTWFDKFVAVMQDSHSKLSDC